ncbi:MAG: hypothetical protein MUE51_09860 [Thermoleophilia bacterium]|nr:hypothetical protein [Thermoleophilia bacterium]
MSDDAAFDRIDAMMAEQQMRHFQLGEMVGEYRQLLADVRETGDLEKTKLARGLPGARYRVNTTHMRESWLVIETELAKLFPRED